MKTKLYALLIFSLAIIQGFSFPAFEKNKTIQSERKEQVEMLMNSRQFVFHARRAEPTGGNSIDLTTNQNYVKFNPDFIDCYLPFFGRAYSGVGYNSRAGLHFQGKPDIFTIDKKKKTWEVTVSVKSNTDNYRLYLSVTPEGFASLSVSSNNLETISYIQARFVNLNRRGNEDKR
jgi:hypothetical protein